MDILAENIKASVIIKTRHGEFPGKFFDFCSQLSDFLNSRWVRVDEDHEISKFFC